MTHMSPSPNVAGPGIPGVRSARAQSAVERSEPTTWVGWVVFAAVMMITVGVLHAIEGVVALFRDTYYVVTSSGLVLTLDYTVWGWIHLVAGIVVAVAGVALFTGQLWARVVAIGVTLLSIVANFLFIGAYPVWSTIMIAVGVVVLYALTVHGRELKDVQPRQ